MFILNKQDMSFLKKIDIYFDNLYLYTIHLGKHEVGEITASVVIL